MYNSHDQNQFYPTPPELSLKLFNLVEQRIDYRTRVLDCSAGDGALLEPFLKLKKTKVSSSSDDQARAGTNIFAIEIEQDLRYVLQGKGYSVIGTDFLSFYEPQKFNVIVMNPPFNDGDDHLLHAWDFLEDAGELFCILNKETIDNPYSTKRKLVKSIIETNGELIDLGQAFQNARRKTNVETVLVKLKKPKSVAKKFQGFNSDNFENDIISDKDFAASPLTKTDYIKTLCDRYKAAENALIARHDAQKQLDFYLDGIGYGVYHLEREDTIGRDSLRSSVKLEDQLAAIKLKFWEELFHKSELTAKATSDFQAKFMGFAKSQAKMSFNYANCLEVLISVIGNKQNIFQDAIDNLFKIGCSFDKTNTTHWEGWVNNSAWKWNKKLVVPYAFSYSNSDGFSQGYGRHSDRAKDFLDDLDKVLSMISGEPIEISSRKVYSDHIHRLTYQSGSYDIAYSSWFETTFLKFRIYKKGTIHIEIIDQSLLAEFNRRAAEGKPWMPDKSSYKQPKERSKLKQLVAA